jgi:hypothetical protein
MNNAAQCCHPWKPMDIYLLIYLKSRFPDWNSTRRRQAAIRSLKAKYNSAVNKTDRYPVKPYDSHCRSRKSERKQRPIFVRKPFSLPPVNRMIDTILPMPIPLPWISYVDASTMLSSVRRTIVDGVDSGERSKGVSSVTTPGGAGNSSWVAETGQGNSITTSWIDAGECIAPLDINVAAGLAS